MSYKTITVNLKSLDNAERLCKFAAMVARQFNAHLVGVHTVGALESYPELVGSATLTMMSGYRKEQQRISNGIKTIFNEVTRSEDFVAEWREVDLINETSDRGVIADWIGADLIIIGQTNPDLDRPDQRNLVELAVRESGRPVLVLPYAGHFESIGTRILLGWSATKESSRAVHDALPFICKADRTKVFWVGKQGKNSSFLEESAREIATALDRHGAKVSLLHAEPGSLKIGDELLNEASESGSDLIVTGGYGHSRVYDFVLGATTNYILKHMTVPTLLAH